MTPYLADETGVLLMAFIAASIEVDGARGIHRDRIVVVPIEPPVKLNVLPVCRQRQTYDALPGRVLARLHERCLHRLDRRRDRTHAVARLLDGLNSAGHGVEQGTEISSAALQTAGREEVDGIVEGVVDSFAGGEPVLRGACERGDILERQQVLAYPAEE